MIYFHKKKYVPDEDWRLFNIKCESCVFDRKNPDKSIKNLRDLIDKYMTGSLGINVYLLCSTLCFNKSVYAFTGYLCNNDSSLIPDVLSSLYDINKPLYTKRDLYYEFCEFFSIKLQTILLSHSLMMKAKKMKMILYQFQEFL